MKRERKRERKRKRRGKVWKLFLCGLLWVCMNFWTFVWILVCSISNVSLGIYPNPGFVESWVGKTLVV